MQGCRGCDLYREATQAVMGDGSPKAPLMLLGEQPGDKEDQAGEPFVGPAGKLLDRALEEAGIAPVSVFRTRDRDEAYAAGGRPEGSPPPGSDGGS